MAAVLLSLSVGNVNAEIELASVWFTSLVFSEELHPLVCSFYQSDQKYLFFTVFLPSTGSSLFWYRLTRGL